jgi:hypothetical protein
MFGLSRRRVIALGAAGLLAMAGVGTIAFAETPTPTPGAQRQNYREVFVSKLATALGVTPDALTAAAKKAESDTIDQAVTNGDLAKNRADEMKQRLQQGGPGFFAPFGGPGFPGGKGDRMGAGPGGMMGIHSQAVEQAIATKLGFATVQDLQTALRSGKSLLTIAGEKNVSEKDLRATIHDATKAELDKAVTAGNLTQAQEDAMLQRLDQAPLDFSGRPSRPARPGKWGTS